VCPRERGCSDVMVLLIVFWRGCVKVAACTESLRLARNVGCLVVPRCARVLALYSYSSTVHSRSPLPRGFRIWIYYFLEHESP